MCYLLRIVLLKNFSDFFSLDFLQFRVRLANLSYFCSFCAFNHAFRVFHVGEPQHSSSGTPKGHSSFFCIIFHLFDNVICVGNYEYVVVLSIPHNICILATASNKIWTAFNSLLFGKKLQAKTHQLPLQPKTHRSGGIRRSSKKSMGPLDQIAKKVQRDRSSTHRCLAKLVGAGLPQTIPRSTGGGYYHVYTIVEPAKIKQQAKEKVKDITDSLQALIENFDADLQKHLSSSTPA